MKFKKIMATVLIGVLLLFNSSCSTPGEKTPGVITDSNYYYQCCPFEALKTVTTISKTKASSIEENRDNVIYTYSFSSKTSKKEAKEKYVEYLLKYGLSFDENIELSDFSAPVEKYIYNTEQILLAQIDAESEFILFLIIGYDKTTAELKNEEYYNNVLMLIDEEKYDDAYDICDDGFEDYRDIETIKTYCSAMIAYNKGGIGHAYKELLNISDFDLAKKEIKTIENEASQFLNGHYKYYNNQGSYLHIVFDKGDIYTGLVGYFDANQTYDYSDDHPSQLVKSTFTTGEVFYAIGYYYENLSLDIDYTLMPTEDSLVVVRHESNKFSIFNGVYKKIS